MPDFSQYLKAAQLNSLTSVAGKGTTALHVPNLSTPELFGLLALVVIFLVALSLGRTRVLIALLSTYIAFTLQAVFPYFSPLEKTTHLDLATLRVLVFFALYLISFLLLNRSILKARLNMGEAAFFWIILMAAVQPALIVSIIMNLEPSFYNISTRLPGFLVPYLATPQALFYWALAPLVIVLLWKIHRK